jgi:hypothetical protein
MGTLTHMHTHMQDYPIGSVCVCVFLECSMDQHIKRYKNAIKTQGGDGCPQTIRSPPAPIVVTTPHLSDVRSFSFFFFFPLFDAFFFW